jgi:hypothetical protein
MQPSDAGVDNVPQKYECKVAGVLLLWQHTFQQCWHNLHAEE